MAPQKNSSTSQGAFSPIRATQIPKGHGLPRPPTREFLCSSRAGNRGDAPPPSDHAPSLLLRERQSSLVPAVFFFITCLVISWPLSIQAGNEKVIKKGTLPPPVVQLPGGVAQHADKILEIKWLKVEGACRYHLQIAEDKEFTVLNDDRKDIRGKAYIFYNFVFKSYYFRVSSIDEEGNQGEWSDPLHLIILPSLPSSR